MMTYKIRFQAKTSGAIVFVGNTLGLSRPGSQTSDAPLSGIATFLTTLPGLQDGSFPYGTTASYTLNRSAAELNLPRESHILYAELIWGGSFRNETRRLESPVLDSPIVFATPTGSFSVDPDPVTAEEWHASSSYIRSAEVTSLIQAGGRGVYTTGKVPAVVGEPLSYAGWTLAVVYEDSRLPLRHLLMAVSGHDAAHSNEAAGDFRIEGMETPPTKQLYGKLWAAAGQGDGRYLGSALQIESPGIGFAAVSGIADSADASDEGNTLLNDDTQSAATNGEAIETQSVGFSPQIKVIKAPQNWAIASFDINDKLTNGQKEIVLRAIAQPASLLIYTVGLEIGEALQDVGADEHLEALPSLPVTESAEVEAVERFAGQEEAGVDPAAADQAVQAEVSEAVLEPSEFVQAAGVSAASTAWEGQEQAEGAWPVSEPMAEAEDAIDQTESDLVVFAGRGEQEEVVTADFVLGEATVEAEDDQVGSAVAIFAGWGEQEEVETTSAEVAEPAAESEIDQTELNLTFPIGWGEQAGETEDSVTVEQDPEAEGASFERESDEVAQIQAESAEHGQTEWVPGELDQTQQDFAAFESWAASAHAHEEVAADFVAVETATETELAQPESDSVILADWEEPEEAKALSFVIAETGADAEVEQPESDLAFFAGWGEEPGAETNSIAVAEGQAAEVEAAEAEEPESVEVVSIESEFEAAQIVPQSAEVGQTEELVSAFAATESEFVLNGSAPHEAADALEHAGSAAPEYRYQTAAAKFEAAEQARAFIAAYQAAPSPSACAPMTRKLQQNSVLQPPVSDSAIQSRIQHAVQEAARSAFSDFLPAASKLPLITPPAAAQWQAKTARFQVPEAGPQAHNPAGPARTYAPPTVYRLTAETRKGSPLQGRVTSADASASEPLTFAALRQPRHGALTLESNGAFRYEPHLGFTGTDVFIFAVGGGPSGVAAGRVDIQVTP